MRCRLMPSFPAVPIATTVLSLYFCFSPVLLLCLVPVAPLTIRYRLMPHLPAAPIVTIVTASVFFFFAGSAAVPYTCCVSYDTLVSLLAAAAPPMLIITPTGEGAVSPPPVRLEARGGGRHSPEGQDRPRPQDRHLRAVQRGEAAVQVRENIRTACIPQSTTHGIPVFRFVCLSLLLASTVLTG